MVNWRSRSWPAPLWLLPLAAVAVLAGRCGKSKSAGDGDPGPPQACGTAADCVPPPSFCADATTLAYFTSPVCVNARCAWTTQRLGCGGPCASIGCLSSSTAGGTGEPPASNGGDAAAAQACMTKMDCAVPPSFCADATTLAYYTSVRCEAGQCQWSTAQISCQGPCQNGGCTSNGTTGGAGGGGAPGGDAAR